MMLANSVSPDGKITINTGPLKTTVKATKLTPIFRGGVGIHGGLLSTGSDSEQATSSTTSTILTGTAVAAGAALLATVLYARYKHKPVKTVLKTAWSKTGGKIHVPHHLHMPKLHLPKLGRHSR
jgi:hypothetical protein